MILDFERKGGLAGFRISITIDTTHLPNQERIEIESLVNKSNFFILQSNSSSPSIKHAADYYKYKISIKKDETEHVIETTDLTMDDGIRPLVNRLVKEAIKAKKSG
jgi:hypothetical protein